MHVISLNLAVALNTGYDHLRVFDCKAFVDVPKDERSKLDMKTRQCIFIGYGQDEYAYRLYDPVENKLVRSHECNSWKTKSLKILISLSEIDPLWMLVHDLDTVDNNLQNDEQYNYVGDQQLGDVFDIPLDDDAEEEQEMSQDENLGDALEPPPVQLRRYTSDEYVTLIDGEEPECYQEAMESEEKQKWLDAMQDEIKSLRHNCQTYDLVKLLNGKKVLENRWIYRMSSIKIVLSLVATFDLEVVQMDVKQLSFMEEIYMKQPNDFHISRKEDYVCKLKKSLYGLKKFSDDDFIILLLYVDDMLIVGKSVSKIDRLKKQLSESFSMKDLEASKQIIGIRITRDRQVKKLWLSQEQYRFHMENAKVVSTPLVTHFKLSSGHSPSNEA
ncbi:hypothetical protein CR513_12375, partial [Mucuna pruriens]